MFFHQRRIASHHHHKSYSRISSSVQSRPQCLILLLILVILSTIPTSSAAVIEPAPSLWASSIDAQPIAFHFSKTQEKLFVFGHNPARIVELHPQDGDVLQTTNLPVLGTIASVRVRESRTRMDFALISIVEQDEASKLVCWDFYLQQVRWEFDVSASNLTLPSVGRPEVADDGTMVFHHFDEGEVYAFNAFSGQVMWQKKFSPMSGWTYLNGSLYGGILAHYGSYYSSIFPGVYQLDAATGDYVDRYRAPHKCFQSGSNRLTDYLEDTDDTTVIDARPNCNNIWSAAVPDKSGQFLYLMDDHFGLVKFDATAIAAGPVWTNAFATDSTQQSQQSYVSPVVSPDGTTVYASAYWTTAAIDAETGATLWTTSQGVHHWMLHDMAMSPYGEALYAPYDYAVYKLWTDTGRVAYKTHGSSLTTFLALDDHATMLFAGGFNVGAFSTDRITNAPSPSAVLPAAIPGGLKAAEASGAALRVASSCWMGAVLLLVVVGAFVQ